MLRYNSSNSIAEVYNGAITSWENSAIMWTTSPGSLGVIADTGVTNYTTPFKVQATGPGTITYSIVKGTLPGGMSFNTSTGVLSGDPHNLSIQPASQPVLTFPFTVRATSSTGGFKDRQFSITISKGGGRGKTITEGNDSVAVSGFISGSNSNYNYYVDSWYLSNGAASPFPLFSTTVTSNTANFAYHTGHAGNSTQWPLHISVQVSSNPNGKVLNRIQWVKHANAVGNCNIWGTNYTINSTNFKDTSRYTFLGRVHMGGFGSASDGTVMTDFYNPNNLGFRYYMVQAMDIAATRLPYPNFSTLGGFAMYGMTLDKV
jgi:hypothetical protein